MYGSKMQLTLLYLYRAFKKTKTASVSLSCVVANVALCVFIEPVKSN